MKRPGRKSHLIAAGATGLVCATLVASLIGMAPSGCGIQGSAALTRWTCLFPSLLALCTALTAFLLPLTDWVGTKIGWPLQWGPRITPVITGITAQIVLIGAYMFALDPAYRFQFFKMAFLIPQPFIAGAMAGLIYWLALYAHERRAGA